MLSSLHLWSCQLIINNKAEVQLDERFTQVILASLLPLQQAHLQTLTGALRHRPMITQIIILAHQTVVGRTGMEIHTTNSSNSRGEDMPTSSSSSSSMDMDLNRDMEWANKPTDHMEVPLCPRPMFGPHKTPTPQVRRTDRIPLMGLEEGAIPGTPLNSRPQAPMVEEDTVFHWVDMDSTINNNIHSQLLRSLKIPVCPRMEWALYPLEQERENDPI
mmetsp:Transcript_958/g.3285  ORF Transcript_958/g.3285 Transcript_958/m.3285 type:complete len:217 (+) Transcript_958:1942-2592(+)